MRNRTHSQNITLLDLRLIGAKTKTNHHYTELIFGASLWTSRSVSLYGRQMGFNFLWIFFPSSWARHHLPHRIHYIFNPVVTCTHTQYTNTHTHTQSLSTNWCWWRLEEIIKSLCIIINAVTLKVLLLQFCAERIMCAFGRKIRNKHATLFCTGCLNVCHKRRVILNKFDLQNS